MKELKARILAEGRYLGGGILKVDGFLNHQLEPRLTIRMGEALREGLEQPDGLVFCNLVEFDSLYGHRNPEGYARALREVDERVPELLAAVHEGDALIFVSDHGNDPSWPGTDHTREYGLLLAYSPGRLGEFLGTRESFADVGATSADLLGVPWQGVGET